MSDDSLARFHSEFWADLGRQAVKPLDYYLVRYPTHRAEIEEEYESVVELQLDLTAGLDLDDVPEAKDGGAPGRTSGRGYRRLKGRVGADGKAATALAGSANGCTWGQVSSGPSHGFDFLGSPLTRAPVMPELTSNKPLPPALLQADNLPSLAHRCRRSAAVVAGSRSQS